MEASQAGWLRLLLMLSLLAVLTSRLSPLQPVWYSYFTDSKMRGMLANSCAREWTDARVLLCGVIAPPAGMPAPVSCQMS